MKRVSPADWWETLAENDYQASQIERLRQADAKELANLKRIVRDLTTACTIALDALEKGNNEPAKDIARGILRNALEATKAY